MTKPFQIIFLAALLLCEKVESQEGPSIQLINVSRVINGLLSKRSESMIEVEMEKLGFQCKQKSITHLHCTNQNTSATNNFNMDIHEMSGGRFHHRIARVILYETVSQCEAINWRALFAEGVRPLPQPSAFQHPDSQKNISITERKHKIQRWDYESLNENHQGQYTLSVAKEIAENSDNSCRMTVVFQSY